MCYVRAGLIMQHVLPQGGVAWVPRSLCAGIKNKFIMEASKVVFLCGCFNFFFKAVCHREQLLCELAAETTTERRHLNRNSLLTPFL